MALGVEAVKAERSVYFATLADIVGVLAKAEREGQLRERIRWFCRAALLIVDEIGYLPVSTAAAIYSSSSSMRATKRVRYPHLYCGSDTGHSLHPPLKVWQDRSIP